MPRLKKAAERAPYRSTPEQPTLEGQAMADSLRELMRQAKVNANTCARDIGASHSQIYSLLSGERNFSALLALKLARYFDVGPERLMLLQIRRDLAEASRKYAAEIAAIIPVRERK